MRRGHLHLDLPPLVRHGLVLRDVREQVLAPQLLVDLRVDPTEPPRAVDVGDGPARLVRDAPELVAHVELRRPDPQADEVHGDARLLRVVERGVEREVRAAVLAVRQDHERLPPLRPLVLVEPVDERVPERRRALGPEPRERLRELVAVRREARHELGLVVERHEEAPVLLRHDVPQELHGGLLRLHDRLLHRARRVDADPEREREVRDDLEAVHVLRHAVLEDLEVLLLEARDGPALRENGRVELDRLDVLLGEVLRRVVVAHVLGRGSVVERRDDAQEAEVLALRDVDDLLERLLVQRRGAPVVHVELDLLEAFRLGHGEVRDDAHRSRERDPLVRARDPDAERLAALVQDHLVLRDRLAVLRVADDLDELLARQLAEVEVRRERRAPLRDDARVVQVELRERDVGRRRPRLEADEAGRDLARDREDREAPLRGPLILDELGHGLLRGLARGLLLGRHREPRACPGPSGAP